jgi:hypothetical protein
MRRALYSLPDPRCTRCVGSIWPTVMMAWVGRVTVMPAVISWPCNRCRASSCPSRSTRLTTAGGAGGTSTCARAWAAARGEAFLTHQPQTGQTHDGGADPLAAAKCHAEQFSPCSTKCRRHQSSVAYTSDEELVVPSRSSRCLSTDGSIRSPAGGRPTTVRSRHPSCAHWSPPGPRQRTCPTAAGPGGTEGARPTPHRRSAVPRTHGRPARCRRCRRKSPSRSE